jgi:hypothetical protein
MEILTALIIKLTLPLKILAMSVFATMARIFYNKEELKTGEKIEIFVLTFFVMFILFYVMLEILNYTESTTLFIAGGIGFIAREILDFIIDFAKNPVGTIKKIRK